MTHGDNAEKIFQLLKKVWRGPVAQEYGEGRIINESTLQSAFYHHLLGKGPPTLRVVTEVSKFLMDKSRKKPDMVLLRDGSANGVRDRRVLAVMELKCALGHIKPTDVKSLGDAARLVGEVPQDIFEIDPRTMNWEDRKLHYRFDSDTLWVFAAVGRRSENKQFVAPSDMLAQAFCGRRTSCPGKLVFLRGFANGEEQPPSEFDAIKVCWT